MSLVRSALIVSLAILIAPLPITGTASATGQYTVEIPNPTFVVGQAQDLTVYVYDEFFNAVTAATLGLEADSCDIPPCHANQLQATPPFIEGNGEPGTGADGNYVFSLEPLVAGTYHVRVSIPEEPTPVVVNAYFSVYDVGWGFSDIEVPDEIVVGDEAEIYVTMYNDAPFPRSSEVWLVVDGSAVSNTWVEASAYESVGVMFVVQPTKAGEFTAEFVLPDGDGSQPFPLIVIPTASLVSANVTASPFLSTTMPLELHGVRDFSRATVSLHYDPAVVEVRSISPAGGPSMGSLVEHDAEAGIIRISVAAAVPGFTGNFTVADIEYAAVEYHNVDSTLELDVLSYERVGRIGRGAGSTAHFHGSLLGSAGDDVLREL